MANSIFGSGDAEVIEIAASGNADIYESDLTFDCSESWYPLGSLCDDGICENSPDSSYRDNIDAGATWEITNLTNPGYGILVIDLYNTSVISSMSVFQMFSDGKTTHISAFSHPNTSSTAPLSDDAGWVELFPFTEVGEGTLDGDFVFDPAKIVFDTVSTRYVMIYAMNDGSLGDADYIELRSVKIFGGTTRLDYSCSDVGDNQVSLVVTDNVGNVSISNANVTVQDLLLPVADESSLTDITAACSAAMPTPPTATDVCAGTITGTTTTTFPVLTTSVITWTYDDGNGNILTQNQNVIIEDAEAPVADVPTLTDLTDACSVMPTIPTATDNCSGVVQGTTTTPLPVIGSTVITWTYVDGNGNTSTQTQNVTITDLINPVADLASLPDLTDECSVNPTIPTATDNCAGIINGTTTTSLPVTAQGTTIITWTFTDGNGNFITQTQNVTITDVTNPVPDVASLPDLMVDCSASPVSPTATDNCAGIITGTTTAVFPITDQGTTIVTWTYDDGNGNTISQDQNVIVQYLTYNETASATICQGNTYAFGTQTLTTAGDYVEPFISENGCDSVVTLTLAVNPGFVVNLGQDDTLCFETSDVVTLNAGIASMTYLWSDNSTSQTLIAEAASLGIGVHPFSVTVTDGICTSVDTVNVVVEICTSLFAGNNEPAVKLYPNPSNGVVYISSDNMSDYNEIIVRDAIGKTIFRKAVGSNLEKIDLTGLARGLYVIEVQGNEKSEFYKLRLE
ncbi:MAG: hypothetical protein CVU05_11930 [Bacteroidetes bacterium HGW-Bacteroidetes-21]|nr:MAG: hypothetical protein CVU05_11930 [Bacteroidetes bacterium HGW-Bacteroidetes-21]